MSILATIKVALKALGRNPLRTILTALGIVFGVAAVIAMVSIGSGATGQLQTIFDQMGTNTLTISSGSQRSGGVQGGAGSSQTLMWTDLDAIKNEASAVKFIAAQLNSRQQMASDMANWPTNITGTTNDFFSIRNWATAKGSLFTEEHESTGAKVIIIGQTVATKLFGDDDPIGQSIRVKNIPFEVIGLLAVKGQGFGGQDFDDAAFIPAKTFQQKIQGGLGAILPGSIMVGASDLESTQRAQKQIESILRERHKIEAGAEDDFRIRNMAEFADSRMQSTQLITTMLAFVAGLALFIGGMGVMNILLVSVVERTREIGIRMAVGARPQDILIQFMAESLVLSGMGGALGLGFGALAAWLFTEKVLQWQFTFPVETAAIAVIVSGLVGVVFGLYPAWKASRLDPIVALRVET